MSTGFYWVFMQSPTGARPDWFVAYWTGGTGGQWIELPSMRPIIGVASIGSFIGGEPPRL